MFSYTREQTTFDIGGKKVGGQPGENPTLMVGSIFYKDQFDEPENSRQEALKLIEKQNEISEKTSVPSLVDIFIYDEDEIEWKIDFALKNIEGVFSLDMPESDVRVEVLEYLEQIDALDRVIYNSLNLGVSEEEREKLETNTPKCAILLGYNPQKNNAQGRVDIVRDGGSLMEKGLLTLAEEIDLDNILLDTAATPYGEKACETLRAVPVFKNEFGLPTGCSLHNTVESWKWLEEYEDRDKIFETLDTSIDSLPILLGADYIYYGPIENASLALPNMAMVDKLVAEGSKDYFGADISENHPYHL